MQRISARHFRTGLSSTLHTRRRGELQPGSHPHSPGCGLGSAPWVRNVRGVAEAPGPEHVVDGRLDFRNVVRAVMPLRRKGRRGTVSDRRQRCEINRGALSPRACPKMMHKHNSPGRLPAAVWQARRRASVLRMMRDRAARHRRVSRSLRRAEAESALARERRRLEALSLRRLRRLKCLPVLVSARLSSASFTSSRWRSMDQMSRPLFF